jgi:hypothetical protein
VDQLAKNMVDIKNSGQMVYGAGLFADVAGYTILSKKMTAQQAAGKSMLKRRHSRSWCMNSWPEDSPETKQGKSFIA